MNWLDVSGPPGSGKSTLCDQLWGHHAVGWDNRLPPAEWHDFLNEVTRLFYLIRGHPSFVAAVRMNRRSIRKMATVSRMEGDGPYIQTGLIQRGLGFGWRINQMGGNLNEIRHYFRLMPVSLGAVFLTARQETVEARNKERLLHRETAHEDRSFQVPLMLPAIEIAKEELAKRCEVLSLNVETLVPDESRAELVRFARDREPVEIYGNKDEESAQPWW